MIYGLRYFKQWIPTFAGMTCYCYYAKYSNLTLSVIPTKPRIHNFPSFLRRQESTIPRHSRKTMNPQFPVIPAKAEIHHSSSFLRRQESTTPRHSRKTMNPQFPVIPAKAEIHHSSSFLRRQESMGF